MSKKSSPIPGLSFSWKRALGITQMRQRIARETGVPTSEGWRGTEDWEHYSEGSVQEILNQCGILLILTLEQDLWRIIFKITKIIMLNV